MGDCISVMVLWALTKQRPFAIVAFLAFVPVAIVTAYRLTPPLARLDDAYIALHSARVTLSRINPLNLKQSHRYRSLTQNQECEQKETKEKTQLSTERKRVFVAAAALRFLRFLLLNYACSLTDKSPSNCVRLQPARLVRSRAVFTNPLR